MKYLGVPRRAVGDPPHARKRQRATLNDDDSSFIWEPKSGIGIFPGKKTPAACTKGSKQLENSKIGISARKKTPAACTTASIKTRNSIDSNAIHYKFNINQPGTHPTL